MHRCLSFLISVQLICCVTLIVGCAGLRPPRVAVKEVLLADVSDEAIALDIQLDLQNPNEEPLELVRFNYRLSIEGRQVFDGHWSAQATLPSRGGRPFTIPAVAPFQPLGWKVTAVPERFRYSVSGSLMYVSPGHIEEILFEAGVRKPTVSFNHRGEVSIR